MKTTSLMIAFIVTAAPPLVYAMSLSVIVPLATPIHGTLFAHLTHEPIAVLGNEDFLAQAAAEGWPGSGTKPDPIIISGYQISVSRHLFRVVNTDLHFVFRDSELDGMDGVWCGLYLSNVTNACIENVVVQRSAIALHMVSISNCTLSNTTLRMNQHQGIVLEFPCVGNVISDNLIENNKEDGILLDYGCAYNTVVHNRIMGNWGNGVYLLSSSSHNRILNNTISGNSNGISVSGDSNTIADNTVGAPTRDGMAIAGAYNMIVNNTLSEGCRCGLLLYSYANQNVICGNSIRNNTSYGLSLSSTTSNNSVVLNDFIYNNATSEAYDRGMGNTFLHNYFTEWIGPDCDSDGIVDLPYSIDGTAANCDSAPTTSPTCPIPEWFTPSKNPDPENDESSLLPRIYIVMLAISAVAVGSFLVSKITRGKNR